jgi:hypothetical protein
MTSFLVKWRHYFYPTTQLCLSSMINKAGLSMLHLVSKHGFTFGVFRHWDIISGINHHHHHQYRVTVTLLQCINKAGLVTWLCIFKEPAFSDFSDLDCYPIKKQKRMVCTVRKYFLFLHALGRHYSV